MFVTSEISKRPERQNSLWHSQATQFQEIVGRVAVEIIDNESSTSTAAVAPESNVLLTVILNTVINRFPTILVPSNCVSCQDKGYERGSK